jgi:TonB-dependent receptor
MSLTDSAAIQSSKRPALCLLTLCVLAALAETVAAQSSGSSSGTSANAKAVTEEKIVVTGQRASIRKAIIAQEAANNIVSVVSADDIGSLPDINAAEALARLPGVSVQRDQGEGRYVTVRGLGPDLNTVTINGALVPAPENGRRGVSLDVLPAGLIRSLEVTKTLTPDMDANSIGGTIEVKTLSAFDLPNKLLSVNLGGGYDTLAKKTSPFGGVLWADRFLNGKLGIALGASGEKREFASDDVETGGAWTGNRLSTIELRDYLPTRERNAFAANIDFRPDANTAYFLQTFYSAFSDDELRDRLTIGNITGSTAAEGVPFTARAERRLRARKYTRDVSSIVFGGSQQLDNWKVEGRFGFSRAEEDQPNALNDVQFRQNGVTGLTFLDTTLPTISGPANLYDPNLYNLNAITFQERLSKDRENHAKFDLTRKMNFGETESTLKFGAKASRREKTNNTDQWAFTSATPTSPNFWGAGPTTLAGFLTGSAINFPQRIGNAIDQNIVRARVAGLSRTAATSLAASTISDWTMNEDINSFYIQSTTDIAKWNVLVGVRNERTKFDAVGSQLSTTNVVSPRVASRSYSDMLPNLQLRRDLDKETSIRAALTKSVVRANFNQLAPGVQFSSPTEATIGNPDLNPLKSTNIDLGIERVLGEDGVASFYYFTKDIRDFTYQTNLAGTGAFTGFTNATGFANGDGARVSGVEISYQHALKMLPGWMSGLIVGANVTYTSSTAKLSRFDRTANFVLSRNVALPGQSDRVANLMLGYESGPFSGRLALNSKSRYLLQTGSDILASSQDIWVDNQNQLDLSVKYQLTKSTQLVFEGLNLNREKYYTYQGTPIFNAQNEQYGRTYRVTIKANLF